MGKQPPPERAADEYVTYLFDRYADTFDESLQNLGYQGPALVTTLLQAAGFTPDKQLDILDAGCGTGLSASALQPFAAHLTGVDLSPAMVDKAGQRGGHDTLVVAELTDYLGRHTAQFDLIVAMDRINVDDLERIRGGQELRSGYYATVEPVQVQLLRRWDPYAMPGDEDIPDPWGKQPQAYRDMFDVIERSMKPLLEHLAWLRSEHPA